MSDCSFLSLSQTVLLCLSLLSPSISPFYWLFFSLYLFITLFFSFSVRRFFSFSSALSLLYSSSPALFSQFFFSLTHFLLDISSSLDFPSLSFAQTFQLASLLSFFVCLVTTLFHLLPFSSSSLLPYFILLCLFLIFYLVICSFLEFFLPLSFLLFPCHFIFLSLLSIPFHFSWIFLFLKFIVSLSLPFTSLCFSLC